MERGSAPCPQCREPVDLALKVCGRCGASLLVEVRLHGPVSEPRTRFALGRHLAELGLAFSELNKELGAPKPVLARGVSREQAAKVGEVLARAGVAFALAASSAAAPAKASSKRPMLVAGLAVLVIAGSAALALRKRPPPPLSSPSPPAPVEVAASPEPVDEGLDGGELEAERPARTLDEVVKSVVSIRCSASMGAGFFVTPTELLTNAHVLCPAQDVMKVVTPAGLEGTGVVCVVTIDSTSLWCGSVASRASRSSPPMRPW